VPTSPRHGLPTLSATFRKSAVFKFTTLLAENPPAFAQSRNLPLYFLSLLSKFYTFLMFLFVLHVYYLFTFMCNNNALIVSY